eukprot:TRINITY_DN215_c0_g2_i8.p1 TRINITY_DN215_c0_g2~~TRINITY_DN215_c0_g2_i8.p1  ORF type:complete len:762 (+),score=101.83 TRINITY_DN215_c0_g2_i8:55-2340(+)
MAVRPQRSEGARNATASTMVASSPVAGSGAAGAAARLLGHHPLEGDGLSLATLYHYLWKRNKKLKGCSVMIPETVIFDGMMPRSWYTYDDKNAELKKKSLREVGVMAIKREFSRLTRIYDGSRAGEEVTDIVAQYMYVSGYTAEGEEIVTVEFLGVDELDNFLTKRQKKGPSLLQKFLPCKGGYNDVVQAIWSPHIFHCERRHNLHKLNDPRWTRFERAVTYEGPFYYSQQAFCAPKLERQVKDICGQIVQHVLDTERKAISRMVLYFKVDPHDQVWLLWSNCLRLQDKQSLARVPMNLAQVYAPPQERQPHGHSLSQSSAATSISSFREADAAIGNSGMAPVTSPDDLKRIPTIPRNLARCPGCATPLDKSSKLTVTVESVLKYHSWRSLHRPCPRPEGSQVPSRRFSGARRPSFSAEKTEQSDTNLCSAESAVTQARNLREHQLLQYLFQQLDVVLYEAYTHFQVSQTPFQFMVSANRLLTSQEKCLRALTDVAGCVPVHDEELQLKDLTIEEDGVPCAVLNQPAVGALPNSLAFVLAETLSPTRAVQPQSLEEIQVRVEDTPSRRASTSSNSSSWSSASSSDEESSNWPRRKRHERKQHEVIPGNVQDMKPAVPHPHTLQNFRFRIYWEPAMSLLQLQKNFNRVKEIASSELAVPVAELHALTPSHETKQNASSFVNKVRAKKSAVNPTPPNNSISPVLLAVLPRLTEAHLAVLAAESAFTTQHVELCQECFLKHTDVSYHQLHNFRPLQRRKEKGKR